MLRVDFDNVLIQFSKDSIVFLRWEIGVIREMTSFQ
jgi:hypothetical protein